MNGRMDLCVTHRHDMMMLGVIPDMLDRPHSRDRRER